MGRAATALSFDPVPEIDASSEQKTKPFYRPELDAVRLFAFLGVFSAHMPDLHNRSWSVFIDTMRFGVPLFFLLSAYLITDLLRRETDRTGSVHLAKFYTRRVLRIWPLYFLIITIGVVVGLFYTPWAVTLGWVASALLLWSNFFVIMFGAPASPFVGALWSISVEEQFYILVPGLAKIGGQKAINVLSVCLIVVAYVYDWNRGLIEGNHLALDSVNMFQFFAAGTLLANLLKGRVPSFSVPTRLLVFATGMGLWLLGTKLGVTVRFSPHATRWIPLYGWAAVLAGTLLIFVAFLGASANFTFPKSILYLGTISYGLYIYHGSVIAIMEILMKPLLVHRGAAVVLSVLSLGITVVVAAASYKWVERPFILLKKRFELVKSKG